MSKKQRLENKRKFTAEVRKKIEEAAAFDATNEEIAFYAGISRMSLHRWLKQDDVLRERVEELRQTPVLLARQTAVNKIGESYSNAVDYLSRKRKKEFSPRQELTGPDGGAIEVSVEAKEKAQKAINNVIKKYGGSTGNTKQG